MFLFCFCFFFKKASLLFIKELTSVPLYFFNLIVYLCLYTISCYCSLSIPPENIPESIRCFQCIKRDQCLEMLKSLKKIWWLSENTYLLYLTIPKTLTLQTRNLFQRRFCEKFASLLFKENWLIHFTDGMRSCFMCTTNLHIKKAPVLFILKNWLLVFSI